MLRGAETPRIDSLAAEGLRLLNFNVDEFLHHGREMANTWQGGFPHRRPRLFNGAGTSPVETFAPNGYGLYDVAGNV